MAERIVEVEWEDSCGLDRWVTEEDCDQFFARDPLLVCSVGFVMRDDDRVLGLVEARPVGPAAGKQWGTCLAIPRSAVRKVTELRRGKK